VLVPSALPDPGFVADAQRAGCARGGAFARLARRCLPVAEWWSDAAVPPELGHERWLRIHAGLADEVAVAAATALVDGVADAAWRLDPVHLHVGLDHLVLTDPSGLEPTAAEAAALADSVAPVFADEGLSLHAALPGRWYLSETDPARRLRVATRSLLAAVGRSIDAYLPQGDDARRWKRLVNEVQMTWFEHPVNRERAARGLVAINSLWLEGRVPRPDPAAAAIGRLATQAGAALTAVATTDAPDGPLRLAGVLLAAQIAGDPHDWIAGWNELERSLFARIDARDGDFRHGARLVLCGDGGWRELQVRPSDRWRVWRRADPAALLAAAVEHGSGARREEPLR
jgi:hypothetical protein